MENVFSTGTVYGESWSVVASRKFNSEELNAVTSNSVVDSQYGKSVCFHMRKGGMMYIPMSNRGTQPNVGDSIDMTNANLVTLERQGETITRIEL